MKTSDMLNKQTASACNEQELDSMFNLDTNIMTIKIKPLKPADRQEFLEKILDIIIKRDGVEISHQSVEYLEKNPDMIDLDGITPDQFIEIYQQRIEARKQEILNTPVNKL